MQKTISVIVPIYNKDKYLVQCLDSLVNQEYKDMEIILVDDGSTDNCGLLCDAFKKKTDNIVVIHKENQGLPLAKNSGIEIADGDYISFLDADDYVDSDFFSKLVDAIDDGEPDIVTGGYVVDKNGVNENVFQEEECRLLSKDEAILYMFEKRGYDWSGCGKLYKRDRLSTIEPWWYHSSYGEDTEINWKLFRSVENVLYVPAYGYHYRIHNDSMMRTLSKSALVYFDRTEKIINEIEKYTNDSRIKYVLNEIIMRQAEWEITKFEEQGDMTEEIRTRLLGVIQSCRKGEKDFYPYKNELSDFYNRHDHLYIYGTGHYGEMAYQLLESFGINITGFLVTEGHKVSDFLHGIPVYESNRWNPECQEGILVAVKDNQDILLNLRMKGVQPGQIIKWYCV